MKTLDAGMSAFMDNIYIYKVKTLSNRKGDIEKQAELGDGVKQVISFAASHYIPTSDLL